MDLDPLPVNFTVKMAPISPNSTLKMAPILPKLLSFQLEPGKKILSNCSLNNSCKIAYSFFGPECCNWWALLLIIFPILTFFGNVLVILAVVRERSLRTPTNYFLVSLAVADLMVAVVVMPFGVYLLFNNMWSMPLKICDCYIFMDVISSTSSILNLVAISIDRFIAVTQPITYAKHREDGRVWIMIVSVWVTSFIIGTPIVFGVNDTPDRPPHECLFNNKDYVIYSSIISFYIPCIVMMALYSKIFWEIYQRAKKQRRTKRNAMFALRHRAPSVVIEPALKSTNLASEKQTASGSNDDDEYNSSSGRTEAGFGTEEAAAPRATRFMLAAVVEETGMIMANLASPIPVPDMTTCLDSGYSPSNLDGDTTRDHYSPPISTYPTLDEVTVEEEETMEIKKIPGKLSADVSPPTASSPGLTFKTAVKVTGLNIFKPAKIRAKASARKEKKATQTLAIVLGVFLACWLPFFSCSVYDAACGKGMIEEPCAPGVTLFYVTTWLGYLNSVLNPLIYTIFNLEFRKAFRKILRLDN